MQKMHCLLRVITMRYGPNREGDRVGEYSLVGAEPAEQDGSKSNKVRFKGK